MKKISCIAGITVVLIVVAVYLASLSASHTHQDISVLSITSITPDHGQAGDSIYLHGKFETGFGSSTLIWLENSEGKTKIFDFQENMPSLYYDFPLTLGDKGCFSSDSEGGGHGCSYALPSKPGTYMLYFQMGDIISNKVPFTITSTSTPSEPFIEDVVPWVTRYPGEGIHVGSTVYIEGSAFTPLGGYPGIGWVTHSHVFVMIKNGDNETGVLWEGWSQGGATSTEDLITTNVPSSICMVSEVAAGECPPNQNMTIVPGQYSLYVTVDGRGTSNSVPLTITNNN